MLKLLTLSTVLLGLALGAETSESGETTTSESSSSESSSSESSSSESSSSESLVSTTTTSSASATTTTATPQKHNDVTSNYYYTYLDTSYFAFAVGQCTQKSLLDGSYMLATCLDTDLLQVDLYSTAGCSDTPTSSTNYTSADAVFNCAGVDTYAKVTISILECSDTTYDVYTALDVCVAATNPATVYTSVYCSGTYGEIQYYLSSSCADAAYYNVAKMNSTCQYLFTTSTGSTKIYGKLSECYVSSSTTATTTTSSPVTTKSAANSHNIFTAIALLFAAVLYVAAL